MIDPRFLSDIVAKGGWCDLVLKYNNNHLIGRIADFNLECVVLEYFDIQLDDFDGYVIIRLDRILEVNKGNWVAHYITVGEDDYEKQPFPEFLKMPSYNLLLQMLIERVVLVKVALFNGQLIAGNISAYLDNQIHVNDTLDPLGSEEVTEEHDIELIFAYPEFL